jgi:hypothetical protein
MRNPESAEVFEATSTVKNRPCLGFHPGMLLGENKQEEAGELYGAYQQ